MIGGLFRKGWLCYKFVGLIIKIVQEIVAQQKIQQSCLSFNIVTECGCSQFSMEKAVKKIKDLLQLLISIQNDLPLKLQGASTQ